MVVLNSIYGFKFLDRYYKNKFEERYDIKVDIFNILEIYGNIGTRRGCLLPGKQIDYDRVNELFLFDFRHEKFGKIILDRVSEHV